MYKKVKNKIESKQLKQKELKRQKQNKEKCFANLKGPENSQWCNLPSLGNCMALEGLAASRNKLLIVEIAVVNTFFVPLQRHQKK
jgi:hypothetical protein